ncbi:MAG: hypothetical protein GYA43_04195 [Bacteroidales bacterium]|nr:hypothetical protein [Bacteroidales bacterium]
MSGRIKQISLIPVLVFSAVFGMQAAPQDSVRLYTPQTKISTTPGQSLDYTITVINNSSEIRNIDLSVAGLPGSWTYTIKSGTWSVKQISVLPKEKQLISFRLEVPLKVNKGIYRFNFVGGNYDVLPLEVNVTEQGTFKTEFTTDQPNMQGNSNSSFTFNATLSNRTAEKQLYSFNAYAPRGWNVTFKANYQAVTSVNVEANANTAITIEIKPPDRTEAGKYKIPVTASTGSTSANLDLEIVITGTYGIELTTPSGLLSTRITAGQEKKIDLVVNNTGTAELSGINMNYSGPVNWSVEFEPKKIDKLAANQSEKVVAKLKADKKAIPGDYMAYLDASTPEATSKISYRVTVETPLLWGWIGILIIAAALGSVYYLFRKYGRR